MLDDVTQWCLECDDCRLSKPGFNAATKLHRLPPARAWERLHVDLIDMTHFKSAEGHSYILVVRDAGTRWTILKPLYNKSAEAVLRRLVKIFGLFGPPMNVVSDPGSEFMNDLFKEMWVKLRVSHRAAAADHHQSNGMAERVNRVVHQYIRIFEAGDQWHEYLSAMMFSINSTVNQTTRYSPAQLMLGRSLLFPSDVTRLLNETLTRKDPMDLNESYRPPVEFDLWRNAAEDNEEVSRKRSEAQYSRKRGRRQEPLQVGDQVFLLSNDSSAGWKDRRQKSGPYAVVAVHPDGNTEIQLDSLTTQTFPLKRLERAPKKRVHFVDDEDPKPVELVLPEPEFNAALPAPSSNGEYYVEDIVGAVGRVGRDRRYRVRWTGYPARHSTWEPEDKIVHLAQFSSYLRDLPSSLSPSRLTFVPEVDEICSVHSVKKGNARVPTWVRISLYEDGFANDDDLYDLPIHSVPPGFLECARLWIRRDALRKEIKRLMD